MEHKKNTHRKALAICRKELDSRTDNFVRFPFQMRDTSIVDMEWTSGRWIELQSGVYRCTTVFSFGFLVHSVLPQLFSNTAFHAFGMNNPFNTWIPIVCTTTIAFRSPFPLWNTFTVMTCNGVNRNT